jgi:hypothetical protein
MKLTQVLQQLGKAVVAHVPTQWLRPNPSIERTSKRLRLFAAAHVER